MIVGVCASRPDDHTQASSHIDVEYHSRISFRVNYVNPSAFISILVDSLFLFHCFTCRLRHTKKARPRRKRARRCRRD